MCKNDVNIEAVYLCVDRGTSYDIKTKNIKINTTIVIALLRVQLGVGIYVLMCFQNGSMRVIHMHG